MSKPGQSFLVYFGPFGTAWTLLRDFGLEAEGDGELKCRMQWPDDPDRTATLTAVFVHLPREA